MSRVGKLSRSGYFLDPETYGCRHKHKKRVIEDHRLSDNKSAIDGKKYLFNNDHVFYFSEYEDTDSGDFGINKMCHLADNDTDNFKAYEYDDIDDMLDDLNDTIFYDD